MNCLRCGRETSCQQVFCNSCLADMERHPVKSDVAVYLPVRKEYEGPRKAVRRRRERTAEETIFILRKRIRILSALVLILVMMLSAAAVGVWLAAKQGAQIPIPNIGQNFQTAEDNQSSAEGE